MKQLLKSGKHSLIVLIALLILVSILPGCSNEQEEARIFTINEAPSFDNLLLNIIRGEELLNQYLPNNVTVEWTHLATGGEQRDALVTGTIDIAAPSITVLATALQNNMPLEYIAFAGGNLYQLYARDESIQTMEDLLDSKKICVTSIGASPHTAFLLASKNDVGDTSVFSDSMITMTNSDAITALISGTVGVDAVVCNFPTVMAAWNSDKVHLVRDLSDEIINNGIGVVFCTSQNFADENPDLIEAFLNAYCDAADMLNSNREKCIEIVMKVYEGCTEEQADYMLDFFADTLEIGLSNYDKLMTFLYENGILEKPAEPFENIPKFEAAE